MSAKSRPNQRIASLPLTSLHASRLQRVVALLVSITFLLPYLAFAFQPENYSASAADAYSSVRLSVNGAPLTLSQEWGRITSSHQGKSGNTVVLIQDLHCNYEVQSHIRAMLKHLSEKNRLQLVGVEGESQPVDVSMLATVPLENIKARVGEYFMQRGRVTGSEYQAAVGQQPLILQGIETQGLYDQSRELVMSFLNDEVQGHCEDLRQVLERLKKPLYNNELSKMDHQKQDFAEENMTLEKYCDFLLQQATSRGVEIGRYPVMKLYALEHRLPVTAEVDYERLYSDAEDMEAAIRSTYYTSQDQRNLDHHLRILQIIENMVSISAMEKDLAYYRGHREEFQVQGLLRFLEDVCYRYAVDPNLSQDVLKLDEAVAKAGTFYEVADRRSDAFVANLRAAMQQHKQKFAVMITGGFHASGVEHALRGQGVSYITVRPRITRTDAANPYFALLQNERTPLERLLEQQERIFAPRSFFSGNPLFKKYFQMIWEIFLNHELQTAEPDLSEEARAQKAQQLREKYPFQDGDFALKFLPALSQPRQQVYVFQFSNSRLKNDQAMPYLVLRSNVSTGYATLAEEKLDDGKFMFQMVNASSLDILRQELGQGQAASPAGNPLQAIWRTIVDTYRSPAKLRGLAFIAGVSGFWSSVVMLSTQAVQAVRDRVIAAPLRNWQQWQQRLYDAGPAAQARFTTVVAGLFLGIYLSWSLAMPAAVVAVGILALGLYLLYQPLQPRVVSAAAGGWRRWRQAAALTGIATVLLLVTACAAVIYSPSTAANLLPDWLDKFAMVATPTILAVLGTRTTAFQTAKPAPAEETLDHARVRTVYHAKLERLQSLGRGLNAPPAPKRLADLLAFLNPAPGRQAVLNVKGAAVREVQVQKIGENPSRWTSGQLKTMERKGALVEIAGSTAMIFVNSQLPAEAQEQAIVQAMLENLAGMSPRSAAFFLQIRTKADDLIARAIQWAQDSGFGMADIHGDRVAASAYLAYPFEQLLAAAGQDTQLRQFVANNPVRLALAGMTFLQTASALSTDANSPEELIASLAKEYNAAERLADTIRREGRAPKQMSAELAESMFGRLVNELQSAQPGTNVILDSGSNLHPWFLNESFSRSQAEAIKRATPQGVGLIVQGPEYDPFNYYMGPEQLGVRYTALLAVCKTLGAQALQLPAGVQDTLGEKAQAALVASARAAGVALQMGAAETVVAGRAEPGTVAADESALLAEALGADEASKVIGAGRTESFAEVAPRAAMLPASRAYLELLQQQLGRIEATLEGLVPDAAQRGRAVRMISEVASGNIGLQVGTVFSIDGGIAVQQWSGQRLAVILEAGLRDALRNTTVVHEVVEAALNQAGVAKAHAIAFVVEQIVFPESIAMKLEDMVHYDAAALQDLIQNLEAELVAIESQKQAPPALRAQQKKNAQRVADEAAKILAASAGEPGVRWLPGNWKTAVERFAGDGYTAGEPYLVNESVVRVKMTRSTDRSQQFVFIKRDAYQETELGNRLQVLSGLTGVRIENLNNHAIVEDAGIDLNRLGAVLSVLDKNQSAHRQGGQLLKAFQEHLSRQLGLVTFSHVLMRHPDGNSGNILFQDRILELLIKRGRYSEAFVYLDRLLQRDGIRLNTLDFSKILTDKIGIQELKYSTVASISDSLSDYVDEARMREGFNSGWQKSREQAAALQTVLGENFLRKTAGVLSSAHQTFATLVEEAAWNVPDLVLGEPLGEADRPALTREISDLFAEILRANDEDPQDSLAFIQSRLENTPVAEFGDVLVLVEGFIKNRNYSLPLALNQQWAGLKQRLSAAEDTVLEADSGRRLANPKPGFLRPGFLFDFMFRVTGWDRRFPGAYRKAVILAGPLLETVSIGWAVLAGVSWGWIVPIFLVAHLPNLIMDARAALRQGRSAARQLLSSAGVLLVLGAMFTLPFFVHPIFGLLTSWALHSGYNRSVLKAKLAAAIGDSNWLSVAPLASALGGEQAAQLTAREQLEQLLAVPRSLAVTENVDSVEAEAAALARKDGRPFLRLTLTNPKDLNRLMTRLKVVEGKPVRSDGPLIEIIRNGGVLMIDYNGSNPQFLEQFNSLYDRLSPYLGDASAHPSLTILGAMNEKQFFDSDSTVRSRFRKTAFVDAGSRDLVATIGQPPLLAGEEALVAAELYSGPQFQETLVGSIGVDERGSFTVQPGKLIQALETKKDLVIAGDSWHQPEFLHFIRQLLLHRQFEFNGQTYHLPNDFQIYRYPTDYSQGVADKQIVAAHETRMPQEQEWVVNHATQDLLFGRSRVTEKGLLAQAPGLLDAPRLRLRVEGPVEDWVWHRIMHAEGEVEIVLGEGAAVPAVYLGHRTEAGRRPAAPAAAKPWEMAKDGKVVLVESRDLDYLHAFLDQELPGPREWVPISPGTTASQLFAAKRVVGEFQFQSWEQEVLRALRSGKTVILEGLESNPGLQAELAGVFQADPYIVVNGERINLQSLPGRLVVTRQAQPETALHAANRAVLAATDAPMGELLQRLYPRTFKAEDYARILKLRDAFQTLPAPATIGLYPDQANFSFRRLCMLFEHSQNWLQAFEDIVIAEYQGAPEVAAYMRTQVRLAFASAADGRPANTCAYRRLEQVLNSLSHAGADWGEIYWQLADTLSRDVLTRLNLSEQYQTLDKESLFGAIRGALIAAASPEERAYYSSRFKGQRVDSATAPVINRDLRLGEENWAQKKSRVIQLMHAYRALFFRGPPSAGKSYLTEQLGQELGFDPANIVGPVTVGVDVTEQDLVARTAMEEGKTVSQDEAVGQWVPRGSANRPGRLFIVDEANLAKPGFWNFMRGFFNADPQQRYLWVNGEKRWFAAGDRVVFTGNPETLAGRQYQELIRDYLVTVNFDAFDRDFLREQITADLYANKSQRDQLVQLLLDLHMTFQEMNPGLVFSLRDLQELVSQVNAWPGMEWTSAAVTTLAWKLYSGQFNEAEKGALQHILAKKFGVLVQAEQAREIQAYIGAHREIFARQGAELTESTAELALLLQDMLGMRDQRLKSGSLIKGKRGVALAGPAGRGKDLSVAATLKVNGYTDAREDPDNRVDPTRKYYPLNASSRLDEMVRTIRKAQAEGSIVIVSEMDLLPSAFLEGKLNDVLTGRAHAGFMLVTTVNAEEFSGRELFSSALKNRIIYKKIGDYSAEELAAIGRKHAAASASKLSEHDLAVVVQRHVGIRDRIARVSQHPTTRELINAVELLLQGKTPEQAIQAVYGPFHLRLIESLPARARETTRRAGMRIFELLAGFMQRRPTAILWDAVVQAGGYHNPFDGLVALTTKNTVEANLRTIDHEAGHGRFTVEIPGMVPARQEPFWPCYMKLEDLRMEHAVKTYYPYSPVDGLRDDEKGFLQAVRTMDLEYLQGMEPHALFLFLLATYVKGALGDEEMQLFSEAVEGLWPKNPAAAAYAHRQAAKAIYASLPAVLTNEAVWKAQYQALAMMAEMKADFLEIYNLKTEQPDNPTAPSETEQWREAVAAEERLSQDAGKPRIASESRAAGEAPSLDAMRSAIKAKQQAIEAQKRQAEAAARGDLSHELTIMETDLKSGAISVERVREIHAQLTERGHRSSLVGRLELLNDKKLNRQAERMVERAAKAIRDYSQTGNVVRSREWGNLFGLLGRKFGRPDATSQPVGQRYAPARAHSQDQARNPIRTSQEQPSAVQVALTSQETAPRDRRLAEVSGQQQALLEGAIQDFYQARLGVAKQWGSEGTLDLEQLVATGNPAISFHRTGSTPQEKPPHKELVLIADNTPWNVVNEEFLHYLLAAGFKVTVYLSDRAYVENVRTLGDLKNLSGRWMPADRDRVLQDLMNRKRAEDFSITTLGELQTRVEAGYLHGLLKNSLDDKAVAETSFTPMTSPVSIRTTLMIYQPYGHLNNPATGTLVGDEIWVVNVGNDTISRFDQDRNFLGLIDALPGWDSFENIQGILDLGPEVWIANYGKNQVVRMSRNGKYLGALDLDPQQRELFNGPYGMVRVGDDEIWVTNWNSRSITRLDAQGGFLGEIRDPAFELNYPRATVVGDEVWVTNTENHHITRIRKDGSLIGIIDQPAGQFAYPLRILPVGDEAWVINSFSDSISRLDAKDGSLVGVIDNSVAPLHKPTDLLLLEDEVWVLNDNDTLTRLRQDGSLLNFFGKALGQFNGATRLLRVGNAVWVMNNAGHTISCLITTSAASRPRTLLEEVIAALRHPSQALQFVQARFAAEGLEEEFAFLREGLSQVNRRVAKASRPQGGFASPSIFPASDKAPGSPSGSTNFQARDAGEGWIANDDLISRALAWSRDQWGFGTEDREGTRVAGRDALSRALEIVLEDAAARAFVGTDPRKLALLGMAVHDTLGQEEPGAGRQRMQALIEGYREAEVLAGEVLGKTRISRWLGRVGIGPKADAAALAQLVQQGSSSLAALIQTLGQRSGVREFTLGRDDSLRPEGVLALALSPRQQAALAALARQFGVRLTLAPEFNPLDGYRASRESRADLELASLAQNLGARFTPAAPQPMADVLEAMALEGGSQAGIAPTARRLPALSRILDPGFRLPGSLRLLLILGGLQRSGWAQSFAVSALLAAWIGLGVALAGSLGWSAALAGVASGLAVFLPATLLKYQLRATLVSEVFTAEDLADLQSRLNQSAILDPIALRNVEQALLNLLPDVQSDPAAVAQVGQSLAAVSARLAGTGLEMVYLGANRTPLRLRPQIVNKINRIVPVMDRNGKRLQRLRPIVNPARSA